MRNSTNRSTTQPLIFRRRRLAFSTVAVTEMADFNMYDAEMFEGFEVIEGVPLEDQVRIFVQAKLERLENIPISIGVAGEVKAGKSTLINTFRDLEYDPRQPDVLVAKVGVQECTTAPTPYPYPEAPNVAFVDLPGINTNSFPAATYAHDVELAKFDMVLIVFKETVHENDHLLARILKELKVPFWFVRTQIDLDLEKHRKLYYKKKKALTKEQEDSFFEAIRANLRDNIPEELRSDVKFFLVHGELEGLDKYDMPLLKLEMANALSALKKQTLILHMRSFLPSAIEEKCTILKSRIKWYALASGCGALVPIPGVSLAVDVTLIAKFTANAAASLGFNMNTIKKYMQYALSPETVAAANALAGLLSREGIIELLKRNAGYITANCLEEWLRVSIPIIGSIIAGTLSFGTTYWALSFVLSKLEEYSKKLAVCVVDDHGWNDQQD